MVTPANMEQVENTVFIPFGGDCDLSCSWCNFAGRPAPASWQDLAAATTRLEAQRKRGATNVAFGDHHTEPTTHPDFPELVRRAGALGYPRIGVATSGLSLADSSYLDRLLAHGLSWVMITVVSHREPVSDLLLGRSGATALKWRALRNCAEQGLELRPRVMFLRPTLGEVVDTTEALCSLPTLRSDERARSQIGGFLPSLCGQESWLTSLLWPRYGEVAWAMEQLRARWSGFRLFADDLPLCVRNALDVEEIGGLHGQPSCAKPQELCGDCDRAGRCHGISQQYLQFSPSLPLLPPREEWRVPTIDPGELRLWFTAGRQLAALGQGSLAEPLGQLPRTAPWTWQVARVLNHLRLRERTPWQGCTVGHIQVEPNEVRVELSLRGEEFSYRVIPRGTGEGDPVGQQLATSNATVQGQVLTLWAEPPQRLSGAQQDSARHSLSALMRLLERSLPPGGIGLPRAAT
jgi:hypothetical protein